MNKLLLACFFIAPTGQAQVIECPKFYPSTDTVLADVPYQHKGKGVVSRVGLTGAGLTVGEFNGGGDIQGHRKDFKGGYEIDFGVWEGPKWFVCFYGPNSIISWWEQLDSKQADCKLKVLNENALGLMDAKLTCK